eukprot:6365906-Pyramimonas_sp.AAC.1
MDSFLISGQKVASTRASQIDQLRIESEPATLPKLVFVAFGGSFRGRRGHLSANYGKGWRQDRDLVGLRTVRARGRIGTA